jgi:hypothetical protein
MSRKAMVGNAYIILSLIQVAGACHHPVIEKVFSYSLVSYFFLRPDISFGHLCKSIFCHYSK